jgi:hypothetical protein
VEVARPDNEVDAVVDDAVNELANEVVNEVADDAAISGRPVPAPGRWSRTTAEVALPGLAVSDPAPATAPSAFDPPRQRFAIGDELGRGGMGRVIAATDVALLRPVAIKQILRGGSDDHARFEREVRITARLEHPSIVPIHDVGRDDRGEPYYVMRRIAGEPLGDRIAATPELGARLALLPNVLAVIEAAAFAHARGIIHRDIKPWNILLGDYGETLLIDWGLARALDEPDPPAIARATEPRTSRAYGTPGFMAPEQARGEVVDARADVYALGATLCYLLTRTTPVGDARGLPGSGAALDRIGRAVPGELVAIVTRALAAAPGDRYRDAGELAADLRRFLTGQLVAAHRYTAWERAARWVRRHRIAVTAAAIALVAIAGASALAIVNVVQERDRADAASRVALERGDQMLVDRASVLAERDPTRAVALLATLPLTSSHTPRARDVAAVAAAGGIARGMIAHRGATRAIELAPDGRRLLSTGDDGAIRIHDLALGTSRTAVAAGTEGGYATWTDAGATITFSVAGGLRIVDVATGAARTLAEDVAIGALWPAADHHVRYVDRRARRLVEQATGGGAPVVIAEDVTAAVGRGRAAIVDGDAALRAIDGARTQVLVRHEAARAATNLAISADGQQVSAVVAARSESSGQAPPRGIDGDVVAWRTATGDELGRWSVGRVHAVFRGPSCWFASVRNGAGIVYALCGSRPVEVLRGDWEAVWSAPAAQGVALAATDGSLALLDETGLHVVAHHKLGTLAIAGTAGAPYVAAAASDGTIAWWDITSIAPPPRAIEAGRALVGADRTSTFLLAHDLQRIVAVDHTPGHTAGHTPGHTAGHTPGDARDHTPGHTPGDALDHTSARASGADRALGAPPIVLAGPVDRAGRMIVTQLTGSGRPLQAVVDTRSGTTRALADASLVVGDRASGRLLFARGRDVIEPTKPGERVVATCSGELTMLAVAGGWAAGAIADDRSRGQRAQRLARIDLSRGRADELALWSAPDLLIVATDGTVWFSIARELWSWNGRWVTRAHVMPSRVTALIASGPGAAVVLSDHSLWLATPGAVTSRLPSGTPRALVFGDHTVVAAEGNTRQRLTMVTGERTRWRSESLQTAFAIGDADRVLVVQTHELGRDWLTRYDDAVPADPIALRRWLARATNATIDPATGALVWPDARDAPDVRAAVAAPDAR